jgi:hypothetical protein
MTLLSGKIVVRLIATVSFLFAAAIMAIFPLPGLPAVILLGSAIGLFQFKNWGRVGVIIISAGIVILAGLFFFFGRFGVKETSRGFGFSPLEALFFSVLTGLPFAFAIYHLNKKSIKELFEEKKS